MRDSGPRGSRPAPTRRLFHVEGMVAALLVAVYPAAGAATDKQFASGSLIIPQSIEYQTTDSGLLGTYGIVYVALYKNAARVAQGLKPITFYWVVQPNKLSQYRCNTMTNALPQYTPSYNDNDGCDFAVQNASGQPVTLIDQNGIPVTNFGVWNIVYSPGKGGTGVGMGPVRDTTKHRIDSSTRVVKYLGGVWVVDATDRQAFLDLLANDASMAPFHKSGPGDKKGLYVNIHSATASFIAPVASVLNQQPPKLALLGSSQIAFLTDVLNNAGICTAITNCGGTYSASAGVLTPPGGGAVYDYYANSGDLLNATTSYPTGRLNVATYRYGILWAGDGSALTATQISSAVLPFLDAGNTLFAEYDSPWTIEGTTSRFQTTTGLNDVNPDIASYEDCNDTSPGTVFFKGNGPPCLIANGANQPYAQTGNFLFDGGQGSYKGYTPRGSFVNGVTQVLQTNDGNTIASAINKDNNPDKGLILYLSGHNFDNGRFWGERIILNTIFGKLIPLVYELARSEPVAYTNTSANPQTTRVYQGTYVQLPLLSSGYVINYHPAHSQDWQFPYTVGHLYEYDLSAISTAAQAFGSNKRWDAATVMSTTLPGNRNIFTVVGGSANLGWKKASFDYTQTTPGTCIVDGNGLCQLSKLFAESNSAGVTTAMLSDSIQKDAAAQKLGMLVQQARGFCASHTPAITGTPNYTPLDSQCDNGAKQRNRPKLGGIDHGSPAVVGPSRYVTQQAWMPTRPVVAYAAGHDGMLHAFFVSGYNGAATATWTAEGQSLPSGVVPGQELWAFVPPGQVRRIYTNDALVDGSINVVDVFGNFPIDANNDGVIDLTDPKERPTGMKSWRTVLTASAGPGGSEVFAFDVTNPLKPLLLWHLDGATEKDGRWDVNADGVFGPGETFDKTNPATYAIKWYDWDDGNASTEWIPTDYNTVDPTVIDAIKTGRYDYRNMGLSYATSVAKVWSGAGYQYVALLSTSASDYSSSTPTGYRGVEVFAIDLIGGQKLWQWEHLYASTDASGIDNTIPPAVALGDLNASGSTARIYAGDMEGHLWELAALDGRNLNYMLASDGKYHSFPLFGTKAMTGKGPPAATALTMADYTLASGSLGQQPLTTPIGQGRFSTVPASADLSKFNPSLLVNRLALVVGTMGVDWAIAPSEQGHLYVLPAYPDAGTRLSAPVNLSSGDPLNNGVLHSNAVWDIPLGIGERVYGLPRVVNNVVVFNTAFGSFAGDITATLSDPGNLWIVPAASASSPTVTANDSKSFGGAVIVVGSVVVTTDTSIHKASNPPAALTGGSTATSVFNRVTPAILKTWERVFR